MRNHAVALHFSKTEASITRSTFSWLSGKDLSWSTTSGMNFVSHHVLQPLIEGWSEENHHFKSFACESIVHDFVSIALVPKSVKLVRNVFDCLALERSCITFISVQSSDFTKDALNQVTNSHSRWDSVRIDNHVRINAFNGKWQVFLAVSHSTSSFLTMSTGELVSNLRDFNGSHLYLNQSLVLLVGCDHNLVNVTFFRMLERG